MFQYSPLKLDADLEILNYSPEYARKIENSAGSSFSLPRGLSARVNGADR